MNITHLTVHTDGVKQQLDAGNYPLAPAAKFSDRFLENGTTL